jgi:hypothetical protein
MNVPRDADIAGWALEAFAVASIDSVPGRLIDGDVADLPRWHAALAPEECQSDSATYRQWLRRPDLELAKGVATPAPKPRTCKAALTQVIGGRINTPEGIAA